MSCTNIPYVKALYVLLPTGSEEKKVLGVRSIPVAILPSCQYITMLHHLCIDMNIVFNQGLTVPTQGIFTLGICLIIIIRHIVIYIYIYRCYAKSCDQSTNVDIRNTEEAV